MAYKLKKTIAELRAIGMTQSEFSHWAIWFARRQQQKELAQMSGG